MCPRVRCGTPAGFRPANIQLSLAAGRNRARPRVKKSQQNTVPWTVRRNAQPAHSHATNTITADGGAPTAGLTNAVTVGSANAAGRAPFRRHSRHPVNFG